MDRTTIHAQNGWLSLLGINRCIDCRQHWPCPPVVHRRDVRDIDWEYRVAAWYEQVYAERDTRQGLAP